jgi:hypothetical protein
LRTAFVWQELSEPLQVVHTQVTFQQAQRQGNLCRWSIHR